MAVLKMGSRDWRAGGRERLFEQLHRIEPGSRASIRLVAARLHDEAWALQYGEVVISPEPTLGPELDLGSMVVVSESLSVTDFIARFENASKTGTFTCGQVAVAVSKIFEGWGTHRLPSDNPYCRWPCIVAEGTRDTRVGWEGPFITTIADKALCFGNVFEVVEHITTFPGLPRVEHVLSTMWVVIEDHRARMTAVERDGDTLIARADGLSVDGRVLATRIRDSSGNVTHSSFPLQAEVRQQLPSGPSDVLLMIVGDGNDDVLDMRNGHVPAPPPAEHLEAFSLEQPLVDIVKQLLLDGETAQCEYKTWFTPTRGNPKLREVAKTVIAMANGNGGTVIVGVEDDGTLSGFDGKTLGPFIKRVNEEVSKSADGPSDSSSSQHEAVFFYGRQLRDELQQVVEPSVSLSAEVVDLDDGVVLLLKVAAGNDPPYMIAESKEIRVRRNATNRPPTREELRQLHVPRMK